MPQGESYKMVMTKLVGRHLGTPPDSLSLRRSPTGKFNDTYFVEGGPVPLVLRIAPPDDRSRMLFYEHRMMRQEPGQHALLRRRTDVPLPCFLAHDFGGTERASHLFRLERDELFLHPVEGRGHTGSAGRDRRTM